MKITHLTDAELQQYITEPQTLDSEKTAHALSCAHCAVKAANYQVLFQGIQKEPSPAFEFDLSALIMEQLPKPKKTFPWFAVITSCVSLLMVTFSVGYFWSAMVTLTKGMSGMLPSMAAVAAASVLIFQILETFRSYQQRMRSLLTERTLQL